MSDFHHLIDVTEYEVLGELPDVFKLEDGTRADTLEKWQARRKELYQTAVELQFGTIPPHPEVLEVEPLYFADNQNTYRIIAGTKEKQISFHLILVHPDHEGPYKTVVDGDGCWGYIYDKDWYGQFASNDYAFAFFDRTELGHDICGEGRRKGQLYEVYPEYTFGAVGAWAWGFRTTVDALEKIGIIDKNMIAFSGHSRGGKAAVLAGVIDERACIVNPNESGAGGCGCYRVHMKATMEEGGINRNEELKDLYTTFPFWMGEGMGEYLDREAELPFDEHFLKALIAPRILLTGDAASDTWANPVGAWQTNQAVKEVYKFLGKEENLIWYYRRGYHSHKPEDVKHLIDVMDHVSKGTELKEKYYETPFEEPEKIFSWQAPEK